MKSIPQVQKYMTPMPQTVGRDIEVKVALGIMREHHIRHLPVQHEGKLIGVVSDRDVKLAASFKGSEDLKVEDIMSPDPYAVTPDTPLDQVASHMAEHKLGSAIVKQPNGKVVGIFTVVDGMNALTEIIHQHYKG